MYERVERIELGKIVKSDSHVRYICQVFGPGEVATPPRPVDFAFGRFVRVPLRAGPRGADVATLTAPGVPGGDALVPVLDTDAEAVGVICDTILVNPAFGTLGPRLSNDEQVELFSPDYLTERAVLVTVLLLGTMTAAPVNHNGQGRGRAGAAIVRHGIPPVAPDLGAVIATLPEADVRAFHLFADGGTPGGARPYLHMGYLPHIIAQDNPLLPMAVLEIIDQLDRLFPANAALLSIMRRNIAWRLKVRTAG
ncbi:MAG TPA: hypothetical protein VGN32_20860 [Ktedonobacterales bacterium]|nr:hypothetical protein [Ktedonobacterales bacterium]